MIKPAWYTWLRAEIGQRELKGPGQDNPRIEEYWVLGRVQLRVTDDETPWCAAAANAALEQSGYAGTRSGLARSFAPGPNFTACDARLGAIVVLSSPRGPTLGHVGFLDAINATHVRLLGGNQGDSVSLAAFPRARVLHMLWPAKAPAHTNYPLAPAIDAGASLKEESDR